MKTKQKTFKFRVVRVWYVEATSVTDAINKSKNKRHSRVMATRRAP